LNEPSIDIKIILIFIYSNQVIEAITEKQAENLMKLAKKLDLKVFGNN
jgi:hypothetical protein